VSTDRNPFKSGAEAICRVNYFGQLSLETSLLFLYKATCREIVGYVVDQRPRTLNHVRVPQHHPQKGADSDSVQT
jgi:hypothetical protein